jgi:glycosyltransferase involved in cell wall biosynthesis
MRIGVDALSVVPGETGGGETYLAGLLGAMEDAAAARGHDVVVHCTPDNARLFRERGAVRLVPLPVENRSRPRRLLFEHLRYARRLKDDRIDLLFAPGNALPLRLPCPAVLGVQSLHSFLVPEEMSRFRVAYFKRIVPMSARRAARVLCVSEDLRQTLLGVVPDLDPAKVRVVHEGAPTDIVRVEDAVRAAEVCREFGVEPGKFVLFVSSLNPFKRPERAVEAVARIRADRGETWPLLLAGRASDEHRARVVAAAKACGAEDLIRIAGTVDRARLAALYSGARAMTYPSVVETFGIPPLEAMACGTPVVASDRTSVPEICGDAAVLVDPDDVDAYAAALHRALHDESLRAILVAKGRARVAHFDWRRAADGTLDLLEEAAGRGPAR